MPTADELPVTRAMLSAVRTELLERVDQVQNKLEAKIHEVRAEVQEVRAEVHALKAEVHGLKAEIHEIKADIHEIKGGMARMMLLLEEQNARNKVVLDGLVAVMARQERTETRLDRVEEMVRSLASARS